MSTEARDGSGADARDASGDAAEILGTECELYLAGRYIERYGPHPHDVPSWVRLNEAAHASLDELAAVASGGASESVSSWPELRARLAFLVVDAVRGDAERAHRVQMDALIPLESKVAARSESLTPRALIAAVEAAIPRV